ncbi:MAG TPA: hypothetical protein VFX49_14255 [Chloroflexota bacterium]|nr:hypothetical protein [Chloroflexota bacterium]
MDSLLNSGSVAYAYVAYALVPLALGAYAALLVRRLVRYGRAGR